jgi:hypothetical protein
VSRNSSFVIRHSGREDARGAVRNGASFSQSLIVSCCKLIVIVKKVAINPIIQSRTRYY